MPSGKVVVLYSSVPGNALVEVSQRNVLTALRAKHVKFDEVDGVQPENKDIRTELFMKSGIKGKYPQIFIKTESEYQFIGDVERFNELLECEQLPREILDANPNIATFSKVFSDVEKI